MASVYTGTGIMQQALKNAQEEEKRQAALAQMTQAQQAQYKQDRTLQPYVVSDSGKKKSAAKSTETVEAGTGYAPAAAYSAPASAKAAAYTPGETVLKAREYLEGIRSAKPGDYVSTHQDRLDELLGKITGRGPFKYDAYTDPMYNIYKDIYIQNGRRAMQDTMGQASALTGGYGNSYAQTAGQQQYNQYMEGLNQMVPELQQQAFERWKEEGNELQRQYDMVNAEENRDYGRYRDQYGDWQTELQLAQNEYGNEYGRDYGAFNDQRNYDMAVDQFNQQMALQYAQLALQQAQFDFQKSQASKKSSGGSGKSSGKSSAAQTAAT